MKYLDDGRREGAPAIRKWEEVRSFFVIDAFFYYLTGSEGLINNFSECPIRNIPICRVEAVVSVLPSP